MFLAIRYLSFMIGISILIGGIWGIQHIPEYLYPFIRDVAVLIAFLGVFSYNAFYITECVIATHGENHKGWKLFYGAASLFVANISLYGALSLFSTVYWLKMILLIVVMLISLGLIEFRVRSILNKFKVKD